MRKLRGSEHLGMIKIMVGLIVPHSISYLSPGLVYHSCIHPATSLTKSVTPHSSALPQLHVQTLVSQVSVSKTGEGMGQCGCEGLDSNI